MRIDKQLCSRFHHLHGRNARISNGGLTASRPNALSEFNDAIGGLYSFFLANILDHADGDDSARNYRTLT